MTFKELKLNDDILKALEMGGFTEPTEIQAKAIPVFLDNKNLFGKSSTGTGKTASFVLPILQQLKLNLRRPQVIMMAPTRELAMQIVGQIRKFSITMKGVNIAPIIGGAQMRDQIKRLRDAQIIVGTPGRINDHLQRGTMDLKDIKTIILDEADEMLKMGFKNEIDAVFRAVHDDVQVGLFSATNTPKVMDIANNYMKDYELVKIDNEIKVNANITNIFIFTKGISKEELILKVFEKHQPQRAIVFSNTKSNTDKIARNLATIGVKSVVINGDKKQSQRTRAIQMFKNNEVQVLVATDVVARGIDISGVDYVINYDISMEDEHFVHRIGRTGRNGTTGNSISFIQNQNTQRQLQQIQRDFKITIDEISRDEYGEFVKPAGNSGGQGQTGRGNRGGRNQGSRDGGRGRGAERNQRDNSKRGGRNISNGDNRRSDDRRDFRSSRNTGRNFGSDHGSRNFGVENERRERGAGNKSFGEETSFTKTNSFSREKTSDNPRGNKRHDDKRADQVTRSERTESKSGNWYDDGRKQSRNNKQAGNDSKNRSTSKKAKW